MDPSCDLQLPPANRSGSRQPVACPDGFWSADLSAATPHEVPWLLHGYLAPGSITLWTSRWKAGKTTLLSILLARRVTGGQVGRPHPHPGPHRPGLRGIPRTVGAAPPTPRLR